MAKFITITNENKDNVLKLKDIQDAGYTPHLTKSGNTKLGSSMWVWSTLKGPATEGLSVKKLNNKICVGMCDCVDCSECKKTCYVNSSYRHGSVILGHAINSLWMKENPEETFKYLNNQLKRARKKPDHVRINQSGEIRSNYEIEEWAKMANANPSTKFYLYTKNYAAVKHLAESKILNENCNNFTVLISIWHKLGVKEYESLKNLSWIKTFVYDDGIVEDSVKPQTYCMAYKTKKNAKGKEVVYMDHNVSCEKCQKCFNRNDNHKIIGCKAH